MLLKGIDTLEFGLEIDNYAEVMKPFLSLFHKLKNTAQDSRIEQKIKIGNVEMTVHSSGQKFYAYRLSCNDFLIAFMEKELASNSPVFVRFLSGYLWSYGVKEAFQKFLDWFSNFNAAISLNKLSRVDISLDTEMASFIQQDIKGVVCRAKSKTEHYVSEEYTTGRTFSGFSIGRGNPLLARIYNKSIEIKKSNKVWFYDIWRVEFQIRREALKELGISSYETFINKQDELWSYLTNDWLSIRSPSKDKTTRWKIKRKWRIIQKADLDYIPNPLIREKIKQGNLYRLLDQAAGLMMSVAALSDHSSISETSLVLESWFNLKMNHKNITFDSEKERRQNQFLNESLEDQYKTEGCYTDEKR